MERRKFVVGLGALAAGTSAAVGSGAFSAGFIDEREVDIAVNADDETLIQLVPGHLAVDNPSTVSESRVFLEDGQLGISFDDEGGGNGVNPNSTFQLGAIGEDAKFYLEYLDEDVPDPDRGSGYLQTLSSTDVLYGAGAEDDDTGKTTTDDPAFVVSNQSDETYVVEIASRNPNETPDREDAEALLLTDDVAPIESVGTSVDRGLGVGLNTGDLSKSEFELGPGESVGFSLLLKVGDVDPEGIEWDTTLEFSLGQAI